MGRAEKSLLSDPRSEVYDYTAGCSRKAKTAMGWNKKIRGCFFFVFFFLYTYIYCIQQ